MTPFEDEVAIAKLEKRLGKLVRRFETLSPGMADLPLYNDKVAVEAVDFLPFGEIGLGALVTPWFINLVFLPLDPVPYDVNSVGQTVLADLPAGQRSFVLGGDEVTGLFWAHSIMSPLPPKTTHAGAIALARSALASVLTIPDEETDPEAQKPPVPKSRREIILGQSPDTAMTE